MKIYRLNAGEFRLWRDLDARRRLKERLYRVHGEAQLRAPSGRILGTNRDPDRSGRVPIEKSKTRGAHHAVSPGECVCREWQKPAGKEHEHHPICVNKAHWEAQQARGPDILRGRAVLGEKVPHHRSAETSKPPSRDVAEPPTTDREMPPVEAETKVPAPELCVCKDWSGSVANEHHVLCEFRAAWELEHGQVAPKLVELETGTVVREASLEEVEASKKKQGEDGVGAIELSDGKLYYVKGQ